MTAEHPGEKYTPSWQASNTDCGCSNPSCGLVCAGHQFSTSVGLLFKLINQLFLERGEGREKERERNINVRQKHSSVASGVPPTRDLACNPGRCPDWESNLLVHRPALSPLSHSSHGYFHGATALNHSCNITHSPAAHLGVVGPVCPVHVLFTTRPWALVASLQPTVQCPWPC